jgi:cytochrome c oxidase cbb3-type subunit 3
VHVARSLVRIAGTARRYRLVKKGKAVHFVLRTLIGTGIVVLSVTLWAGTPRSAGPDLDRGKATYKELCAKCHGSGGKGDGKEASTLNTKPQDLTNCVRMATFNDEQLFRAIKEGGSAIKLSKDMPSYSESMEDDEIHDVLAFVHTLCVR